MGRIAIQIVLALGIVISAHSQTSQENISRAKEVILALHGDFTWEMFKPSENKFLRSGSRTSQIYLDSTAFFAHELFDNSKIEQISLFGFNPQSTQFYSTAVYNVDTGPHIMSGRLDRKKMKLYFFENDSTKHTLEVLGHNEHRWTSEKLADNVWVPNDLLIVFRRNQ